MPDDSQIYAQVVHVIQDPYTQFAFTVVINRGEDVDVNIGDEYIVFGLGDELVDPQTKRSLGRLELVRGRGRVSHVQEKVSHLRCVERSPSIRRSIKPAIALLGNETFEEQAQELPFDRVRIGDYAKPIRNRAVITLK